MQPAREGVPSALGSIGQPSVLAHPTYCGLYAWDWQALASSENTVGAARTVTIWAPACCIFKHSAESSWALPFLSTASSTTGPLPANCLRAVSNLLFGPSKLALFTRMSATFLPLAAPSLWAMYLATSADCWS